MATPGVSTSPPVAENEFIEEHGWGEFGRWFAVHRCGVLAAESRAGQRRYFESS
jgi:hypothetical protein